MKKFGLLCLAIVLALGTLGVGYAAWTDTVFITGNVNTGEVCIEIVGCDTIAGPFSFTDPPIPAPPYTEEEGADPLSFDINSTVDGSGFPDNLKQTYKNVGWITAECTGDGPPYKTATVTFHNMYPGYYNHLAFGIHNCGTIPVKLDHVTFTDEAGYAQTLYNDGYLVFDLSGEGTNDFEIYWGDNFGDQIEPCDKWSIDFWIHFLQDEDIDFSVPHTYTLTIEVVAVQWNEYPLPTPY
jgi:hypothetical protein